MSEKENALLTIGILCVIIGFLAVADLWTGDRVFSETENRILASKPEFSREKMLNGSYAEEYEAYVTDQFVGRDKWIGIKTRTDILLQKETINGVYLGKDGYLIEQHKPEDYLQELIAKRLQLLKKFVNKWDAKVMLVPTADNILTDKLPAHAISFDQRSFLKQVEETVGNRRYVDVYSTLERHAPEDIYYRTDHHWTSLGAYYGYHSWTTAMKKLPFYYAPNKMETVTDDFLGTLHSKINFDREPDIIQIFPETNRQAVSVTYDFQKQADSYYEESHLNTKNKYGYFLDDNHGFVEIQTGYQRADSLFVIKDSYANCLIPLLAPHYKTIYMVDLRYFNGRLFPFMEQYVQNEQGEYDTEVGKTDVLILYNCIHFLEGFQYN